MNNEKTLIASTDREMLDYLMQAFDSEMGVCGRCGHEESTATCDSATFLRDYLAAYPAPTAGDAGTIDTRTLDKLLGDFRAAMDIDTKNAAVRAIHQHVADEKTHAYGQGYAQGWQDFEKLRDLGAATAPVSAAEQAPTVCAKLPNGAAVTNVYEAYAEGLEQAAKVCDVQHDRLCAEVAEQIRLLKGKSAAAPAAVQELPALTDFAAWLSREMPAGTVIADPAWWAPRLLRAALAVRQPQFEAVGLIVAPNDEHPDLGWHFKPWKNWEAFGAGATLYAPVAAKQAGKAGE